MKKNQLIVPVLSAFLMAGIWACAEAPKTDDSEETTEEVAVEDIESESMDDEDMSFMLPSPIQIAAIFSNAGLEFESELINPVENQSNYVTKTAKFLNFGVYSADLAYAVLNDQQQMSIDYLNAVKTLSDEIGMPGIFGGSELIESFERNIDNQDTILYILTTVKRRTDQYLEENADQSKEAVFFSGAWLEGMHLGANSSTANEHISARLIEQMGILDNLILALRAQDDESLDLAFMVEGLTKIQAEFNEFESVKALDMDEVDIDHMRLTEEELTQLKTDIEALRTQVIGG